MPPKQVVSFIQIYSLTDSAVLEKIKKNKISKCVFLAQKALFAFRKNQMSRETKKILEVSISIGVTSHQHNMM